MTETTLPDLANPRTRELCGTMEVHRRLLTESITYQERRALIENRAMAYDSQARDVRADRRRSPFRWSSTWCTIRLTLPKTSARRRSTARSRSSTRISGRSNPDVSKVPGVWTDRVADCEHRVPARVPGPGRQSDRRDHPDTVDGRRFRHRHWTTSSRARQAARTPGQRRLPQHLGVRRPRDASGGRSSDMRSSPAARRRPTASSSRTLLRHDGTAAAPSTSAGPRRTRSATG